MNCDQAKPLIEPYADGELDTAGILELERHLSTCPACAFALRNVQSLKKAIKHDALFFTAPEKLRQQLKAELRAQAGSEPERTFWNWNWLTAITSSAATACLLLLVVVAVTRPSAQQQLAQEIVSGHVRSLMAGHELDVASTDQHTVKPWFAGKLDFSPPVKDLAAQGFPLVGGRLDYMHQQPVAALIFERHRHIINLFIWPAKEAEAKPGSWPSIQGYNLVHWSQGGMTFWAVSDLNANELKEFAGMFGN